MFDNARGCFDMSNVVLRLPDVIKRVGLSRSSVYARIAAGDFPSPIQLGGDGSRAIGFKAADIDEWLANRPRGVRPAPARAMRAA